MHSNDETIIINKQVLIQAVLELERQEAYRTFLIWEYLEDLELLVKKLHGFVSDTPGVIERNNLLELLEPGQEWDTILTDELLYQWEAEFKAEHEKDFHPPSPGTPDRSDSSTAEANTDAPH